MQHKGITIVVPLFNREQLIKETIISVLAQSSDDWQLNIVDDGSTDQSFEVAQTYAHKDPRINVWRRQSDTKGAPTCRNEGFQKSSYDYVIFLDSDDLLGPDCVKKRLQGFMLRPDLDFLVYSIEMFDRYPGDSKDRWCFKSKDYFGDFLDAPLWQTAAPVWKKEFLLQHNLDWRPDLKSWQDWDFHVRALAVDPAFDVFPESVDCYCRRSQSGRITSLSSQSPEMLQQRATLFEETTLWLNQAKLLSESRKSSMARQFTKVAIQFFKLGEQKMVDDVLRRAIELKLISKNCELPLQRYIRFESTRHPNPSLVNKAIRRLRKQWFYVTIPEYVIRRRNHTLRLNPSASRTK